MTVCTRTLMFTVVAVLAVSVAASAREVEARAGKRRSGTSAAPLPVSPAIVEEAQAAFRAAVELYAAGDYDGAQDEFDRAYHLAPTYKLLYNLAQTAYQRRDYVLASRYFTRYLDEGRDAVEPPRRAEVERELVRLRMRIGELEIVGAQSGSDVFVDDVRVGVMPLPAPLAASVGRRRIEIVDPLGRRQLRHVDVTAGGRLRISFAAPVEDAPVAPVTPPAAPPPPSPPPPPAPAASSAIAATTPTPERLAPPSVSLSLSEKTPPPAPEPRRRSWVPWVTWGLTAVAATGALVCGRQALLAADRRERALDNYPVTRETLDGLSDDQSRWALATDGALLATAVLGAFALYVSTGSSSAAAASGP